MVRVLALGRVSVARSISHNVWRRLCVCDRCSGVASIERVQIVFGTSKESSGTQHSPPLPPQNNK